MLKYFSLFCAICLFFFSCKEAPIEIPRTTTGRKVVLVEELTGVRCPNCPAGTQELTRLSGVYGKNLIIVANHSSGIFSIPMTNPPSTFDFRAAEFKDMAAFIGSPDGYPAASINRIVHGSEAGGFAESTASWGGYIQSELAKDPFMDMTISTEYNPDTRECKARVLIAPSTDLKEDLHLTVMVTQDSIIDAQTVGTNKVPDYVHRHVLRKLLTKYDGDALDQALTPGSVIERTYTFSLPADFVEKHCSVVAAVHRVGNPDKAVLQAAEAHVVD